MRSTIPRLGAVLVSLGLDGTKMDETTLRARDVAVEHGDVVVVERKAQSVEVAGKLDGRIMSMMFAPTKKKPEKKPEDAPHGEAQAVETEPQGTES